MYNFQNVRGFRGSLAVLATATLLLCGGAGPGAQEDGSPPPLELGIEEEVEVQLVLVDFLAVDRKDRTVADLSAEELLLLVDGRDVEIASLDRDCPGGATEDPRAGRLDSPPDPMPTAQPRKIVLVFDYYHMTNSAETFDQVFEMLDKWSTGDERHMVVSLGQVVRVETPFTTDLGEVRWALERMRNDPDLYAGNHSRLTEWPFFERIEVLFDLLERIHGRKTIVLFSGPFSADGFYHDPAYRKLSAMSTIARTAVYPVDTGGLRTLIDPGNRPLGGPGKLRRLANDTGGRMTADTNELGLAYARAHRDLGCTYTLGFYDQGPRHDDRRRLTIRPSRDGVRIVYPEFYVVRSEEKKKKSLFHTASMTPHMFESDDLKTDLFLLGPQSGRRWKALLAVEARLTADEVAEDGEEWLLKGVVRKPNGTVVRSFKRRVPMTAAGSGRDGASVVTLFEGMSIAPGRYIVSAVLADPEADTPRAATRPAEVAEVPRGTPFMVGPILGHRTAVGFEPLLTAEAEQGEPLDSLTLVCVAGVERGVDAVEGPPPRHELLAAAALFGGRSEDADPARRAVRETGEGEAGADARRRDQVVPAGVADLRQRVVLRQQRHAGAAIRSELGLEGRFEAVGTALDLQPGALQGSGEERRGVELLESELRVRVDGVGEFEQLGPHRVHGGARFFFQLRGVHVRLRREFLGVPQSTARRV